MDLPPADPVRFLLLDDDEDGRFLNSHALKAAFPGCEVLETSTCEEALALSADGKISAILSDHHLHGSNGVACISALRQQGIDCPIVLVTNSCDPRVHAAALAAGATHACCPSTGNFVAYLRTVVKSEAAQ
jgi:CheY-like chemotaxis protein